MKQAFIEDGNLLSKAEKERRVDECDLVTVIHHGGVPLGEVLRQLNAVIAGINDSTKKTGYIISYVHRYENETAILIKFDKGKT
jgi:hypothetical protein